MKVLTSILTAVILISQVAFSAPKRPIAAVKEVKGIVKLKSADSNERKTLTIGTLLYDGDRLTTQRSAMAAVLFTDGSLLKINDLSDVTLNVTPAGGGQLDAKVDIPLGQLWAKVTRRDTKFEVETPSSVASVKGTEFSVEVMEDGSSSLFVFQGLVEFGNEINRVMVKRNQKSVTMKGIAPSEPAKMDKEEKKIDDTFQEEQGSSWRLEIEAPGEDQNKNQAFGISVKAVNPNTGAKDFSCRTQVVISSSSSGAQFSLDGNTWAKELTANMNSGQLELFGKARSDGNVSISAAGTNCTPTATSVGVVQTNRQKNVESDKIDALVQNAGIEGLEGLNFKSGDSPSGMELDQILEKIESGDLIIDNLEITTNPDGSKNVSLKLKQGKKTGSGPSGQ